MKEMGIAIRVIRSGYSNMFLSPTFRQTVSNGTGAAIELYDTDGALGAARGAAVGGKVYRSFQESFQSLKMIDKVYPDDAATDDVAKVYDSWLSCLSRNL